MAKNSKRTKLHTAHSKRSAPHPEPVVAAAVDTATTNQSRSRKQVRMGALIVALICAAAATFFFFTRDSNAQEIDQRYPLLENHSTFTSIAEHTHSRFAAPAASIIAMVDGAAFSAGVPSRIAHAVIRIESRYRSNARSSAGALGMMQIKCASARGIGFAGSCRDLFDGAINLSWGMKFLRLALDKGGQGCAGISLYNVGIYAHPRCTGYGRMVLAMAR